MFSTKLANEYVSMTREDILSRATELDIYEAYLGKIKVGQIYNSPLRKDENPSFGLFYSKRTGQLLFKDLATGDCGNVFKFVGMYTGLKSTAVNKDIIAKLNLTNSTCFVSSKPKIKSHECEISVVRQPFSDKDLAYWLQFGITHDTLIKYNVSPITYYLNNSIVKWKYEEDNPMYAYKVYNHFKIYRPLSKTKKDKWRNSLTIDDIQGYKQLPKSGEVCIITKSLKDVMCLYEMGIPAISPSCETTFISDIALERILKRFKRVYICFDRDSCGLLNSVKIWQRFRIPTLFIHKRYKSKDISDAIKNNGFNEIKNYIYEELNKPRNLEANKRLRESLSNK